MEYFKFSYLGSGFYLANLGFQCPVWAIVSEFEECKAAATQLGRAMGKRYGGYARYYERPAGCFYYTTDTHFLFEFANPSATNIDSRSAAVCKKGTSNIL